jgi:ubiquinone/menaquinone biosynthesis C-methylase UbiE
LAQIGTYRSMKLLTEYTTLAPIYDQRWLAYLDASLHMTFEKIADLPTERVLDIACGTGRLLEMLSVRSEHSELVGIDKVPAMLNMARRKLGDRATLLECDAAQLPFDDADYQLITCTSALHYFPNVDVVLREIRRVLSLNGNLIITDWCRDYAWMKVMNRILPWTQHAHAHTLSSNELEQSLSKAGFRIRSETKGKIDWFWGLMTVHATPV